MILSYCRFIAHLAKMQWLNYRGLLVVSLLLSLSFNLRHLFVKGLVDVKKIKISQTDFDAL